MKLKVKSKHVHAAAGSHLHLQLFGGGDLQLGGNGALQRVSNQRQTLAAVVGNGQHLTFHGLPVHPVPLQEGRARGGGERGVRKIKCFIPFLPFHVTIAVIIDRRRNTGIIVSNYVIETDVNTLLELCCVCEAAIMAVQPHIRLEGEC